MVWRSTALAAVLAAALAAGCAQPPTGPPVPTSLGAAAGRLPAAAPDWRARPSLLAPLHRAADAVAQALAVEPHVTPPDDPIRLASGEAPPDPELFRLAGRVCESQGNPAGAAAYYRKALELQPNHVPTLIDYARLLDRNQQFEQALQLYGRAAQVQPNDPSVLNDLGMCLARHGRLEQARATLEQAMSLAPQRPLHRNNLAAVLVQLGRYDEAFAQLAAVHSPAAAHYNLGYLLHRAGRDDAALNQFQQALAMDPSLTPARVMLQRLAGPAPPSLAGPRPVAAPASPLPGAAPDPDPGIQAEPLGAPAGAPAGAGMAPGAGPALLPPLSEPGGADRRLPPDSPTPLPPVGPT